MWYYHIHANLSKKWQLRTPDRPQDIVVWWGSDCYCLENCLMFKFVFVSVRFESPTKLTSVLIQRCQLMLKWPGIRKRKNYQKGRLCLVYTIFFNSYLYSKKRLKLKSAATERIARGLKGDERHIVWGLQ